MSINFLGDRAARTASYALALVFLAGVVGCGSSRDPNLPEVSGVRGTFTYKGSPVVNAFVSFHPVDGGVTAMGQTDQYGNFKVSTFEHGDGAIVGEHTVTVQVDASAAAGAVPGMAPAKSAVAIPGQYASAEKSPLTAEVKRGGNTFEFDLK
ncbi:hypothetical protein [Blastopirellula marina]|uniref:Carboxypeptidase regulatory-like domain-containing protein n=1 Tax=Blastopirellula marina TaxID=124 RepID=A0A2S8GFF8_9BACT|nr:hypothetical protein [Blastopirellula marina]PQO43179.1 hypothetical protein C5Y93_26110 [Blastopirellula marina]